MQKKILVITGSPRKGGNSELLAEAFIAGASRKGHAVTRFDAAFRRLSGCTACDSCWSRGRACVIEDDFTEFSEQLEAAEVIAFAYPLYWSVMPAQLKMLVDRLYAYCSPSCARSLAGKQSVLLLCGECEGDAIFEQARAIHAGLDGFLQWKPAGEIAVHTVFERGAIAGHEALLRAEALGASL